MGLSSLCSLCARHYDGSRWFQHKLWGGMGRTFTAIQCFSMLFLFLDWCLARWLRRHHLFKSPTSTPKSTITMVPTQTNWTEQHRTTSNNLTISYNSFTAHSRSFVECRCALAANYSQIISLVGGTARIKEISFLNQVQTKQKKKTKL